MSPSDSGASPVASQDEPRAMPKGWHFTLAGEVIGDKVWPVVALPCPKCNGTGAAGGGAVGVLNHPCRYCAGTGVAQ